MIFKLLLIYVVTLPLMKTPHLPLLAHRLVLSDAIFILLFILWLKDLIKNKRLPQDTGLNKPFFIFMVFCSFSFFNSANLFVSTIEILGLIYLFIMLMLVVDIINNKRRLDMIIKVWIGTLAAVLILGFIGWFICIITNRNNPFCWAYHGNLPYLKDRTIYRTLSTFRNPLSLASYLIPSLGFVVSDLLLTENKRYRFFLKIMICLIFLSMLIILSREILGLMLVSFLIYNYFHKIKSLKFRIVHFLWISFIIILFLFITIFYSLFYISSYKVESFHKNTHKELALDIDYAYDVRLALKVAALEMVKNHPFLGVGLAMYRRYLEVLNNEDYFKHKGLVPIYEYSKGNQYFDYIPINDPHNDLLQYFAETGVFGGMAFILFIATFIYSILNNLKKIDAPYFKMRLFCFFASFVGLLIESIDLDVFKARHLWFLMALSLALIMIHKREYEKD